MGKYWVHGRSGWDSESKNPYLGAVLSYVAGNLGWFTTATHVRVYQKLYKRLSTLS